MQIDLGMIERGVKIGLMPHELCLLLKRSIPLSIAAPFYKKHFKSYEDLVRKYRKRMIRGTEERKEKYRQINKLRRNISIQIADMIVREMGSVEYIIGYKIEELYDHLEKNFKQGMSWDNRSQWHIDHKKPRSSFSSIQLKECFDLSNLQPLWAKENLKKGRSHG